MTNQKVPWLERQLRRIIIEGDDLQTLLQLGEGVYDDVQPWSLLKLVSLRYLGDVYAIIMKKRVERNQISKMCYVDFFSGSGLGKTVGGNYILGSPLIINSLDKKVQFTNMFLNDLKRSKLTALNSRMKGISQTKFTIKEPKDANTYMREIEPEIRDDCHSFMFIDPYSTEFSWESMELALGLDADIFFLYQTGLIARGLPVAKNPRAPIKRFFRNYERAIKVSQDAVDKPEALFELYKRDISDTRKESVMESIQINKGQPFYYDMLFITRKTSGGNPWFDAVKQLKKHIESYDSEAIKNTLNIVTGKQAKLEL